MEHSSIVDLAGWRSLALQLVLVAVAFVSVMTLVSLGGQLIVAPGLLPVQWLIARHLDGWVATLFAVLGALLVVQVLVVVAAMLLGKGIIGPLIGIATGLAVAILFFRTSRRRE